MDSVRAMAGNGFIGTNPQTTENGDPFVPCPAEQHNWLVWLQYTRGQLDRSSDILQGKETNEFVQAIKARLHFEAGRWQEAIEAFHACNKLNPENVEYVKYIGKCLLNQGRHSLALEVLTRATTLAHQDWESFHLMAECWLSWSRHSDDDGDAMIAATNCAKRATQIAQPQNAVAACLTRQRLGGILSKSGKIDEAITVYEEAISISGGLCASAMAACGALRASRSAYGANSEDGRRAFALLSGALAADPEQREAALALAAVMQQNGERQACMSRYRSLLADEPLSVALLNNVAVSYHDAGKYLAAMWCLSRCYWRVTTGETAQIVRSNSCRALVAARRSPAAAAAATALMTEPEKLTYHQRLMIAGCFLMCNEWRGASQSVLLAFKMGAPSAYVRTFAKAMIERAPDDVECQSAVDDILKIISESEFEPTYEEIRGQVPAHSGYHLASDEV